MSRIKKWIKNLASQQLTWRLRRSLLIQLLKTTCASGVSYAIANAIVGGQRGYFAPLAAILVMQGSVAESLSRAVQRVLGVIAGVAVALALGHFVGLNTVSISLLIFISLAIGHQLNLGATGIPQVAISALMIMVIGSLTHGYWWERIYETVIGAIIGTLVYAFVLPPSSLPQARASVSRFARELSALMYAFAGLFEEAGSDQAETRLLLLRARKTNDLAKDARAALNKAREGLRWHIHREQQGSELRYQTLSFEMIERVSVTSRVIGRLLDDHAQLVCDPGGILSSSGIREQIHYLFMLCGEYLDTSTLTDIPQRDQELAALVKRFDQALGTMRQAIDQLLAMGGGGGSPEALLLINSMFTNAQILMHDLSTHYLRMLHPDELE